jgi:hypothetical protein
MSTPSYATAIVDEKGCPWLCGGCSLVSRHTGPVVLPEALEENKIPLLLSFGARPALDLLEIDLVGLGYENGLLEGLGILPVVISR